MKNIILYALLFFVFTSCTSEKILKIKKLKYDWYINDIASQDNGKLRPYNLNNNLKNRFIQNQIEAQSILSSVEENQDFLASKDKTKPSVLTSNYTYKKLPQIIQNDTINKSFNEKPQIFENEKSTVKKSKIKDIIKKILRIIGASVLVALVIISMLWSVLGFLFNEFIGAAIILLIGILLAVASGKSIKKIRESNSDEKNNKIQIGFGQVLLFTLTLLASAFTGLVLGAYGLFFYGNFFENIFTPLGSISLLISGLLIYRSYISIKKIKESNSKDNDKNDVKDSTD